MQKIATRHDSQLSSQTVCENKINQTLVSRSWNYTCTQALKLRLVAMSNSADKRP